MICEGCQHQNPDGARFCNECGTPLKRKCPGCQAENPPKAKFCSECGQPLGGGKAADSGSTAELSLIHI